MQVLSTFKARSICRLIVAETPVQQQCFGVSAGRRDGIPALSAKHAECDRQR